MSPEVAESEHLRKQIETLERELHSAERHEHEDKSNRLKRFKSKEGRKYITRPKIRAYFEATDYSGAKGTMNMLRLLAFRCSLRRSTC